VRVEVGYRDADFLALRGDIALCAANVRPLPQQVCGNP
jgi:hypothetical protein